MDQGERWDSTQLWKTIELGGAQSATEEFPIILITRFDSIGNICFKSFGKSNIGKGIYKCPLPMDMRIDISTGPDAQPQVQSIPVRGHPKDYAWCCEFGDWIQWEFLIICRWCKTGPYCQFRKYCAIRHCRRKCPNRPYPPWINYYYSWRDDYDYWQQ